ncbi:MAG: TIGR02281 family clan AA aspartic protease [Gammaproteobacteria bacterium]|nr:TIGR02281 family clan AA aspartic protease [Gammaproteobacteria bacterium]
MHIHFGKILLALSLLGAAHGVGAASRLSLQALFKDRAIIVIDGARRVLKTGDISPEGVKLVETDTREETATVAIDGKPQVLRLGVVAAATPGGRSQVTLYAGGGGHFTADGFINDAPVRFLVDTGATSIAMNSRVADRLGIDYKRIGKQGVSQTASGLVRMYGVKLAKVQVGEITMHNVDAGVIEGSFPTETLLGMSFLGQLDMKREGEKLELKQR